MKKLLLSSTFGILASFAMTNSALAEEAVQTPLSQSEIAALEMIDDTAVEAIAAGEMSTTTARMLGVGVGIAAFAVGFAAVN